MTRTGKTKKNKNTSWQFFLLFIAIAVVIIVLLEYIDFKKSEKSFIFTKIIPLKKEENKTRQFNRIFLEILNKNKIPHDYFQDKQNKYHFELEVHQAGFDALIAGIKIITGQLNGNLELTEIQGKVDRSIMLYEVKLDREVTHLLLINKLRPARAEAAAKKPGEKPVKSIKVKPNKEKPIKEQPIKEELIKKEFIKEEPIKKEPIKKEFIKEEPIKEKPIKKEFIKEEPIKEKPKPKIEREPRIAFIIDDIGAYEIGPLELKRLDIPITASVLPDSHRAGECVHWLGRYGIEVMIHLPMQPANSNEKQYDPREVITIHSTDEQIRELIRHAGQVVPTAKGLNNHEGSLVTSDRQLMIRILKIVKEQGLFFVDSRTIGQSAAYDAARELNIKAAYKDVFLDHIPGYSHAEGQVRKLVEIALQKGKAIAIGHPQESTLRAIDDSKEYIKKKGVKIVFVEELLE